MGSSDESPAVTVKSPTDENTNTTSLCRRGILQAVGAGVLLAGAPDAMAARGTKTVSDENIQLIEADEGAGFNFPYYFYAPSGLENKPILVEPVNSGSASDDFDEDLDAAERTVSRGRARRVSDALNVALLVPVFANPRSDDFWNRFIQSLDTETMQIDSGEFTRIDHQLIQMIDDARNRLETEQDVSVPAEVMLNGFSASGNFVNNFTALHPDRVASVTAGAINGMATLPVSEARGETVNYQIGVADIKNLIGESFAAETWREVPQLCYMGAEERSPNDDTIPFRDVWNEEQAERALRVYGDDMQEERMVFSETVYQRAGATARFEVYDHVGHSYNEQIISDIIQFHRRNGVGDSVDTTAEENQTGEETQELIASSCDSVVEFEHEAVTVGFSRRPTAGDTTVDIETAIDEDYGMRARTRLFPETGGGRWGLDLDWVEPGVDETREYEIRDDVLALGEVVEVRAFPEDWSQLEDVIAASCQVVTGVKYTEPAKGGAEQVAATYLYPEDASEGGELRLLIDDEVTHTVTGITAGEFNEHVFSVADIDGIDQIPGSATVSVELQTPDNTVVDVATAETPPTDAASLSIIDPPVAGDQSVAVEYDLASSYDPGRFATLRAYTETGSEWGIQLTELSPGERGTAVFDISTDEAGLPFVSGASVRFAIVHWDDPYARTPLADTTEIVGDESASDSEVDLTITDPVEVDDIDPTSELAVVVEVSNLSDQTIETEVTLAGPEGSDTQSVTVSGAEQRSVDFTILAESLPADSTVQLVASTMEIETELSITTDVATQDGSEDGSENGGMTSSDTEESAGSEPSESDSDTADPATSDDVPGFGVVSSLTSIGGLAYLLKRRLHEEQKEN